MIVLFALLYFTNGLGLSREHWAVQYAPGRETNLLDAPWHESLGNALYFSTITFATVGYGDIAPKSQAGRA